MKVTLSGSASKKCITPFTSILLTRFILAFCKSLLYMGVKLVNINRSFSCKVSKKSKENIFQEPDRSTGLTMDQ